MTRKAKVVVLDDDPTGTQTVSAVPVLTRWNIDQLVAEFVAPEPAVYLLTNSRSIPGAEAEALSRAIGCQIAEAERISGVEAHVISRSDSTLRGHFPTETLALERSLGKRFDGLILCPFFYDGGRVTSDDTHFVIQDGTRVPVAETEFARDRTFGYRSSHLADWVREKYGDGAPPVVSLSLEGARSGTSLDALRRASKGSVIIVNAETPTDLAAQVAAVKSAEGEGRKYLFRTAADWVAAYAGVVRKPLLSPRDYLSPQATGGLIVVGSYVEKTTLQLEDLLKTDIQGIELGAADVCDPLALAAIAESLSIAIENGEDAIVYTSRDLSQAGRQDIGRTFSNALVEVVRNIATAPAYIVTKGGITSSDIATRALGVQRAWVEGQAAPGVSVWRCGPEAKYPNLPLLIFPGNVGAPTALTELHASIQQAMAQIGVTPLAGKRGGI